MAFVVRFLKMLLSTCNFIVGSSHRCKDAAPIIAFVLLTACAVFAVISVVLYIIRADFSSGKVLFRIVFKILIAAISFTILGLNFFYETPNGRFNSNKAFFIELCLPQTLIAGLSVYLFFYLNKFTKQFNIKLICGSFSYYFAFIYFTTSVFYTVYLLIITLSYNVTYLNVAFATCAVVNDVFNFILIVYPMFLILFTIRKQDSLNLMRFRTILSIVITILFSLLLITRIIFIIMGASPPTWFDYNRDSEYYMAQWIQGMTFYGLDIIFIFVPYLAYFLFQSNFLDGLLDSVEGTASTNSAQGSLYLEASKIVVNQNVD